MYNLEPILQAFIAEDERLFIESEKDDSGNPFTICTNGAKWLRDNFFPTGKVVGYSIERNPTAEIGQDTYGHDFVLVDGTIIDFWYRHVCGEADAPIVLDIIAQADIVKRYYGDWSKWETLPI